MRFRPCTTVAPTAVCLSPLGGASSVKVRPHPVQQRFGLIWVYIGDGGPHPLDDNIPEGLRDNALVIGGRTDIRKGNWRFAAENGFGEGHAKYLHNRALWQLFKVMRAWNKPASSSAVNGSSTSRTGCTGRPDMPGLGLWTNKHCWKRMPLLDAPGKTSKINPIIKSLDLPGFVSIRLPGMLCVAYPHFIHY